MNRIKDIVDLGILIDDSVTEKIKSLDEEQYYLVYKKILKEKPIILTDDILNNILKPKFSVKVIKSVNRPNEMSVQDIVLIYNDYFNKLKDELKNKLENASSIRNSKGKAEIIGMVKDIVENGFIIEDLTGEIFVEYNENKKVEVDDVLGVIGLVNNNFIKAEEIVFPDVKIKRPKYSDGMVLFLNKINDDVYDMINKVDFIITTEKVDKSKIKPNVNVVKIDKFPIWIDVNGVVFLFYISNKEKDPIEMLKKRRFANVIHGPLEPVPDIFVVNGNNEVKNYKSITSIMTYSNFVVNLKDRSIKFTGV